MMCFKFAFYSLIISESVACLNIPSSLSKLVNVSTEESFQTFSDEEKPRKIRPTRKSNPSSLLIGRVKYREQPSFMQIKLIPIFFFLAFFMSGFSCSLFIFLTFVQTLFLSPTFSNISNVSSLSPHSDIFIC